MTSIVSEKFAEGKKLFENGREELLPLLKAIQKAENVTGNSPEYKDLCKAIDVASRGEVSTDKNKDGFIKGQEVSSNDYWATINKNRAKK